MSEKQCSSQADEGLLRSLKEMIITKVSGQNSIGVSSSQSKVKTISFKCGDEIFEMKESELSKIPYLETLVAGNFQEGPDSSGVIQLSNSCDPKLMKAVFKYINTERTKYLFTEIPEESSPTSLFTLLDYLLIPKPSTELIILDKRMKDTKSDYDKYERMSSADRPGARDACVELCWLLSTKTSTDFKDVQKLYNLVLYVVSHPRTYYPARLRDHVLSWYLENFLVTPKQKEILLEWQVKCCPHNPHAYLDSNETSSGGTPSEDSYNSDDYDGYSS